MRNLLFFLRVYLKKPVIYMAAAVLFAVSIFAFSTEQLRESLPCAAAAADESEEARRILSYLEEKGFVLCEDEEEVRQMVRAGKADSGIVFREGFDEKLRSQDLKDSVFLISTDRSANTGMFKLMTAIAVYQNLMPYTAADMLEKYGYAAEAEDILRYEPQIRSQVHPLEFNVVSIDGEEITGQPDYNLPVGALSITVFVMFGLLCAVMIRRNAEAVKSRFPSGRAFFGQCILPQCAAAGILCYAAAALGLLAASVSFEVPLGHLLPALIPYLLILIVLFSLLVWAGIPTQILVCLIAADAAVSLFLCPLYGGTLFLLGWIRPLRVISAPYLLYLFLFL